MKRPLCTKGFKRRATNIAQNIPPSPFRKRHGVLEHLRLEHVRKAREDPPQGNPLYPSKEGTPKYLQYMAKLSRGTKCVHYKPRGTPHRCN